MFFKIFRHFFIWCYYVTMQELDEKHKELKDLTASWFARVREHTDRPEVLGALQTMITTADKFLTQVGLDILFENTVKSICCTGLV